MKIFFLTLLSFVFTAAISQEHAPIANMIRKEIAGEISSFNVKPEPIYKIENTLVVNGNDSIAVRLYFPKAGKNLPIIYNIHGGALVAGDLDTHDNICRILANKTNSIVVAGNYRRPPEFPYPASLNDCIVVLNWIKKASVAWGGDNSNLFLMGDSGGGLLLTALLVKERNKIPVKKIILINPAVDIRNPGEGLYGMVTKMYLNNQSANDSVVSPILATDISFFPPTLIITCEKDILKAHGTDFHEKLKNASVPAKLIDIPNEDHLGNLWAAGHLKAKGAMDETVKFITGN